MARYISTPARATGFANRCVYSTPGTYTFTVPDGVTSVKAIAVGGGAPGSTGFVEDFSEVSQIACVNYKASDVYSEAKLEGYRCYGYGWCNTIQFCNWTRRTPFMLTKYAYAYTGAGGGYSEKTIAVTPGDTFNVTVGDEEETSSLHGTSGCITATGAAAPTVTRTSAPCRCGWYKVDASGAATTTAPCVHVCECGVCTPQQAQQGNNTQWYGCWRIYPCDRGTCYKFAQTLDCPVLTVNSVPGCGVGGDVNYTGGGSKKFNVKTLETNLYSYSTPNTDGCQACWCDTSREFMYLHSQNRGVPNCTNCNANAWPNIISSWSTHADIQNNCVGDTGGCAVKLAGDGTSHGTGSGRASSNSAITNCLMCSSYCLHFSICSNYDLWEGWCCSCTFMGYKMPAFKTLSASKQFLEANQGGSSAGSPLGNGCFGGTGCTIFGAETESIVCQTDSLCSILGSCAEQWCNFFTCRPYIYCNPDCGFTNFNYYTSCPDVGFYDRYETPWGCAAGDEDVMYAPIENLHCDHSIINPLLAAGLPWLNKAGCTDTCTGCICAPKLYFHDRSCYWSCQRQCSSSYSNNFTREFGWESCKRCEGCNGHRTCIYGAAYDYNCPGRYCCSETNAITIHPCCNCQCCNCCCGICGHTQCFQNADGTFSSCTWTSAFCCGICLYRDHTTVDDIVCTFSKGLPWMYDYWTSFKACAEGESASEDHKTMWCVMCGSWNAELYNLGYHYMQRCQRNHGCSCNEESRSFYRKTFNNKSCYHANAVNYGMPCQGHTFRCNGVVKSRVSANIDAAAAVVIPGSAGGPNAEGQSGYVLGDDEIYIAGTGADKAGSTQPQYILTGGGASMNKSTFDRIRSNYNGDLMAWYLDTCWKSICTDHATGGNPGAYSYGCVPSLENFDTQCPQVQRRITAQHYAGTCCGINEFNQNMCLNQCCGGTNFCCYGAPLYACAVTEFMRKFNLHDEEVTSIDGGGVTAGGCRVKYTVVDVGTSGGIVIAPKSKAFSGDPLCINTGGSSSTASYAVYQKTSRAGFTHGGCHYGRGWRYDCCGCKCNLNLYCYNDSLSACVDGNENCKFTHHFSNLACPNCFCDWYLPWYHFGGDTSGCSCMGYGSIDNHYYLEVTKEVGGGASDVFINEKYTGSTLSDEYLFDADDAVFGGTGQICVNGTTLHSLPGLTQGGSVGGCIKKGNETQDVTQTPYSGGIFPKGTPGYGGGGTVCGSGGTGLVVVYWN